MLRPRFRFHFSWNYTKRFHLIILSLSLTSNQFIYIFFFFFFTAKADYLEKRPANGCAHHISGYTNRAIMSTMQLLHIKITAKYAPNILPHQPYVATLQTNSTDMIFLMYGNYCADVQLIILTS